MADDLSDLFVPDAERNPLRLVQNDLKRPALKRFYTRVEVVERDGLFALTLDGKSAHTPARKPIAVARREALDLVAAEWAEQGETIQPGRMPATRLVNSAIDGVAGAIAPVRAEIVDYAGSDLVCYRAEEPASLASAQAAAWDPVVGFARDALDAWFLVTTGIVHVAQPPPALAALARDVDRVADPVRLAALHTMTTLTGSALIALMVAHGRLDAGAAWAAAHVDEDFQMRAWGTDEEALARRAARWRDMAAAAALA